jgi:hypothetical protein
MKIFLQVLLHHNKERIAQGIDPFEYVKDFPARIPEHNQQKLVELCFRYTEKICKITQANISEKM